MKDKYVFSPWPLCFCLLFFSQTLLAQESLGPQVIPESAEALEEGTPVGWHPLLKASGNFAFGQSKNVPSNPDGVSLQFGYVINGALGFLSDTREHEWATSLLWELGYNRTPVVDAFVKSVDNIDFRSTYLYHFPKLQWLGPFFSFRLTTAMLPGDEIRADPTNAYRLTPTEGALTVNADGTLTNEAGQLVGPGHPQYEQHDSLDSIDLTDAFAPLTLRESIGFFAIPVDKTIFKLDIRLGFGAWETFVQDGYVLEDDEATETVLELRQMQDSVQAGPELGIAAKGLLKDTITYGLSALFMYPIWHSIDDTDLDGMELLNMEFEALLGVKLLSFMSLDYSFKAYRQPFIVDAWQIQNNILISLNFDIIGPSPESQKTDTPK